jgi:signal transduction histidine kinase
MEIPSASATLHELLGISSHDISNPLQTIGVLLEILGDLVEPSHPAHVRVTQAAEAGERMRVLVKDLGDFVRHSPGANRPREPQIVAHAVHQVLARRRARQQVEWSRESQSLLTTCAEIRGPLHLVMTDFVLGAIAVTRHAPNVSYELLESAQSDNESVTWRLQFVQICDGQEESAPIAEEYQARIVGASRCPLDFGVKLEDPSTLTLRLFLPKEQL